MTHPTFRLTYAKVFGRVYGKSPPQKLHYTVNDLHTLCGLDCYSGFRDAPAWTETCARCEKIKKSKEK